VPCKRTAFGGDGLDDLIAGYRRFRQEGWPERQRMFEALAQDGQQPAALVIGCVDSRVDPSAIFDVAPGQILTIRNVANLVPPYAPDAAYHGTSAALEFAVRVLQVPHVVVLGHGQCSGIHALLRGAPNEAQDFVAPWMGIAAPARAQALRCDTPEAQQRCLEHEAIKLSLANLMTFPWIAERVAEESLTLHGAWFAIYTGVLAVLGPDGTFTPVA